MPDRAIGLCKTVVCLFLKNRRLFRFATPDPVPEMGIIRIFQPLYAAAFCRGCLKRPFFAPDVKCYFFAAKGKVHLLKPLRFLI